MGLRTLVREDLAMRGLKWTKRAPQGVPNPKVSEKLEVRMRAWNALDSRTQPAYTKPGSRNPKKRP